MIVPRYYQEDAINAIFRYFHEHPEPGNPLVLMPTGTGKSIVIGEFAKRVLHWWPRQRILVLTHVKELIQQNYDKFNAVWPGAPAGIFSAGLNRKEYSMPVVFAGIGSVHGNEHLFGWRDLVLIDEAHLISGKEDSMYSQVFAKLRALNPNIKFIGLTATDYRLGLGRLTEGEIFDHVCYDITKLDAFNKLVAEGYLAPLFAKPAQTQVDLRQVGLRLGEFNLNELQSATQKITQTAMQEFCYYAQHRKSWLIFASGIENTEFTAELLNAWGIPTCCIHSKVKNRDELLHDFKAGKYRCAVNNNILTTGFDHPAIDIIGVLRATMSPGLWVQMLGRGTRPFAEGGKTDCLVMDFAGNTNRLGPINDPVIPTKKGDKLGDAPVRICDSCGVYNHASARFCIACGAEFTFKPKIFSFASDKPVMRTNDDISDPVVEDFPVSYVTYSRHEKPGSMDSMRVDYFSGSKKFKEYICFEHTGNAKHRAHEWWRLRMDSQPPETVAEALEQQSFIRQPKRIRVRLDLQFPTVLGYEF